MASSVSKFSSLGYSFLSCKGRERYLALRKAGEMKRDNRCQYSLADIQQRTACPLLTTFLWIELLLCCSVAKLCLNLWDPMDCSTPGFPVLCYLPAFAQTQVHWVIDTIQPSHLLSSSSPALSLSQHQGFFQWVSSLHQVAKLLELQHQFFQWIFRGDFLWDRLVWFPCSAKRSQKGFSSTTIWKQQFFSAQPSIWSNSHISTWLLGKTQLWLYGPFLQNDVCFLICYLGLS